MTTLVLSPIFALTLASAAQSVAGARAAAVSRAEARFMPPAEPDLHGPHTAAPMPAPTPTAQAAPHNGTPARPRQARLPLSPTAPSCTGPTLTSQSQVQPSTSYCGGHATSRIVLASNDTWTGGEVSGVSSGFQQGAVQCGNPCTLINMNIHDNPNAFAGIYAPAGGYLSGPMTISGGRVSGSGSLGIGGSAVNNLTISGVEIDHNGASASCGPDGVRFKIDHNRADNNADGGIRHHQHVHRHTSAGLRLHLAVRGLLPQLAEAPLWSSCGIPPSKIDMPPSALLSTRPRAPHTVSGCVGGRPDCFCSRSHHRGDHREGVRLWKTLRKLRHQYGTRGVRAQSWPARVQDQFRCFNDHV
jgi:hypothetical protein